MNGLTNEQQVELLNQHAQAQQRLLELERRVTELESFARMAAAAAARHGIA